MARCAKCGGHAEKVPRRAFERLLFASAYRCRKCKNRTRHFSHWWTSTWRFVFSRTSVCVKCGTERVHSTHKRDPILDFSKHPLSLIQVIFAAPRKQCPYCRLEYYDVRPVARARPMRAVENLGGKTVPAPDKMSSTERSNEWQGKSILSTESSTER